MTSRQRSGEFDSTFQHIVDFGLGVIVDSNAHGVDTRDRDDIARVHFLNRHAF